MPVTVAIQPDPFKGRISAVADYIPSYESDAPGDNAALDKKTALAKKSGFDLNDLRYIPRPLMGVQVKPNTPAFGQVIKSDGTVMSLLNIMSRPKTKAASTPDGGQPATPKLEADTSTVWTHWFLQSVKEERVEKTQLVETFGEPYFYAFGSKPRTLVFQGALMNTEDFNWRGIFWENWEQHFRATRLVQNDARMYVSFDDILVEGYPISAVANQVSESPNLMVFSFTFFVTNYTNLTFRAGGTFKQSELPQSQFARVRTPEVLPGDTTVERTNQKILRLSRGIGGAGLVELANTVAASGLPNLTGTVGAQVAAMVILSAGNIVRDLASDVRFRSGDQAVQRIIYGGATLASDLTSYLLKVTAAQGLGLSQTEFNAWFGEISWLANVVSQQATFDATTGAAFTLGETTSWLPYLPNSIDSAAQVVRGIALNGMPESEPVTLKPYRPPTTGG